MPNIKCDTPGCKIQPEYRNKYDVNVHYCKFHKCGKNAVSIGNECCMYSDCYEQSSHACPTIRVRIFCERHAPTWFIIPSSISDHTSIYRQLIYYKAYIMTEIDIFNGNVDNNRKEKIAKKYLKYISYTSDSDSDIMSSSCR